MDKLYHIYSICANNKYTQNFNLFHKTGISEYNFSSDVRIVIFHFESIQME